MYRLQKEDGTSLIQDDDCFLTMWKRLWDEQDINAMVEEVMSLSHWEYDFKQMKGSIAYVTECLHDILKQGMENALHKHFG